MRASGWPSFPFRPALVTFGLVAVFLAGACACVPAVLAQQPDRIRPVTDAELLDPSPDEWLMWRRTLDGWGYSPARSGRPAQRRQPQAGVEPRPGHRRPPAGNPLDPQRRAVHAEPTGHHPGHRRGDPRPDLGMPTRPAGRPGRPIVANGKVYSGRSSDPRGGPFEVPNYDPELKLVYVGMSVTSPAPKFMLGGADLTHLYHNLTLALHGDTGEIVSHYQYMDVHWDLEHRFERLPGRRAGPSEPRDGELDQPALPAGRGAARADRHPRQDGHRLHARPGDRGVPLGDADDHAERVSGIDDATGQVTENVEPIFTASGQQVLACPHASGGKDWESVCSEPTFPLDTVFIGPTVDLKGPEHARTWLAEPETAGSQAASHPLGEMADPDYDRGIAGYHRLRLECGEERCGQ